MPDHVLHILVEGPTETTLLQSLLSGHLASIGVRLAAPTELRGNVTFDRVVRESCMLLKTNPGATVTTFFDYYGRGRGWLDRDQAQNQPAATLGRRVERLVYDKIVSQFPLGGTQVRFVPYVQLYELEALMFSMPELLLGVFQDPEKRAQVMSCLREVCSCEEINTENFPAQRLKDIFGRYKKGDGQRSQARSFAEQADLGSVRTACPRFSEWVSMLERLPNLPHLPPPL